MTDTEIIDLYFARSEDAVAQTAEKYGALCRMIAGNIQRYWYFRSVREIAGDLGVTESRVKVSLHRSRETLRRQLEQEGITI